MTFQETIKVKSILTIEIKTVQTFETEFIRIIDHKTIPTIERIIINKIIDPVIILQLETTTIQTDQNTILNHHIEIIPSFQIHKIKTIEAVRKS